MSREEAFEKKAEKVNCELSKMKSLSQRERFKAMDIITSDSPREKFLEFERRKARGLGNV